MIILNSSLVDYMPFFNGTTKNIINEEKIRPTANFIRWCFDDYSELFVMSTIMEILHSKYPSLEFDLEIPYIPIVANINDDSISALKAFTKTINNMNFSAVYTYDPTSDIILGMIDRLHIRYPNTKSIEDIVSSCDAVLYISEEMLNRYQRVGKDINKPKMILNKNGNDYFMNGFDNKYKTIIIHTNILRNNNERIKASIEMLKNFGVENIHVLASHCENYLEGIYFNGKIFTTDSIYTSNMHNVEIIDKFRRFNEYE